MSPVKEGPEQVQALEFAVSGVTDGAKAGRAICSKENHLIRSSHDLILSTFSLPPAPLMLDQVPKAPRVTKSRYRVLWDQQGIEQYSTILAASLPTLIELYGDHHSPSKFQSLLLKTSLALENAACMSFKTIQLGRAPKLSRPRIDPETRSLSIQVF